MELKQDHKRCDQECPARALFRQIVRDQLQAHGANGNEIEGLLAASLPTVDSDILSQYPALAKILSISRKEDLSFLDVMKRMLFGIRAQSGNLDECKRLCYKSAERLIRDQRTKLNAGRLLVCLKFGAEFTSYAYCRGSAGKCLKAFLEDYQLLVDEGFHSWATEQSATHVFFKVRQKLAFPARQ